jgi:predicted transcriptional regulator
MTAAPAPPQPPEADLTARLNARLDGDTARQLHYLTTATGQSISHVVREAIAVYHVQVRQQQGKPSQLLALAGRGDSALGDLARNYKAYLTDGLTAKHRARAAPARRKAR